MRKHKGYAFFAGMWFAVFILFLMWAGLEWYNVSANCDEIENAITEAGLASLEYDTSEYALSQDKVLKEFRNRYNPKANYWLLCKYLARNTGCEGLHTSSSYNNTDSYYSGRFKVTNQESFGTDRIYYCRIRQAIFYNVTPDGTEIHDYTFSTVTSTIPVCASSYSSSAPITPIGDTVTKTSVYIDFEFPVKFAGKVLTARRQVYVGLADE